MAAADRLSALPDDALQRVLCFAPVREAAASAILSRRWRTLWRRTGTVNLDSRPYGEAERRRGCYTDPPTFHAFFRDAQAAFNQRRGGTGLKRLTLFLETAAHRRPDNSGYRNRTRAAEPEQDRKAAIAGLLADPALARLEDLRIASQNDYLRGRYDPPLASLSCAATLRVLELRLCNLPSAPSPGLALPSLTDLTLHNCFFTRGDLQVMVDAAPALANLVLVNIRQRSTEPAKGPYYETKYFIVPLHLRCPTVTDLVVVETDVRVEELKESAGSGIELDMPSLRTFRFCGYPIKLSLTSPAPGLARVELDVAQRHTVAPWDWKYEPLSCMLTTFSSTRALKLRLKFIEDVANQHCGVVLPTFPNLELLEIDAQYQYDYKDSTTAVAMAKLLHSCPAMSELRLRLAMFRNYCYRDPVGGPFGESVKRFERFVSMSSAQRAAMQLDGVSELPDVFTNNCAFRCLQKSLRKVKMQFKAKEVNCFEVQLAKFLVENAMVLEEMHIDDGSQFLPDHLLDKVERWRADALRKRNLQPDTAADFRVYQLAGPGMSC